MALARARERPALEAEKFALDEGSGQRRAVDPHKGRIAPRRHLLDRRRHDLLAAARLARHDHRRVIGRHAPDALRNRLERRRPREKLPQGLLRRLHRVLPQTPVLGAHLQPNRPEVHGKRIPHVDRDRIVKLPHDVGVPLPEGLRPRRIKAHHAVVDPVHQKPEHHVGAHLGKHVPEHLVGERVLPPLVDHQALPAPLVRHLEKPVVRDGHPRRHRLGPGLRRVRKKLHDELVLHEEIHEHAVGGQHGRKRQKRGPQCLLEPERLGKTRIGPQTQIVGKIGFAHVLKEYVIS